MPTVSGHGGYKGVLKTLGKKALTAGGRLAGNALGTALGVPEVGGGLGEKAGSWLSRLIGFGKYEYTGRYTYDPNSIENTLVKSQPIPTFQKAGDKEDGVIICHREFLGNVYGSVEFTNTTYPINPGASATFPWLSVVAAGFTEYEMLGCMFEYVPSSGNIAGASPALGIVILATNYNVHEPSFKSKTDADSAQFAVSSVPCSQTLHPVECKPRANVMNRYLIRSSVTTGDLALYDFGNFQIMAEGMQGEYVIGELWVTYHVRLSRPQLPHVQGLWALLQSDGEIPYSDNNVEVEAPLERGVDSTLDVKTFWDGVQRNYIVMPPISGDYMIVSALKHGNGWTGEILSPFYDHLNPDYCQAIKDPYWIGLCPAFVNGINILASGGVNDAIETAVGVCFVRVDATTYNSQSEADRKQRSVKAGYPKALGASCTALITTVVTHIPDLWTNGMNPLDEVTSLRRQIQSILRRLDASDHPQVKQDVRVLEEPSTSATFVNVAKKKFAA